MGAPVWIGITTTLDACGRLRAGRRTQYLDAAYAGAIAEAGGAPVQLPIQPEPGALLERVDALLIPGGDDFAPARPYPSDVRFEIAPPEQVAFDRALIDRARAVDLPVLGICYGMQLLALAAGGSLHHHLPADLPDAGPHALRQPDGRHALRVEPRSRLADWLGAAPPPVNSQHHQAVAAPGESQRVSARAPDGVIEAIESASSWFCVGVQWHPEKLDGRHRAPFHALVAAARARRAKG